MCIKSHESETACDSSAVSLAAVRPVATISRSQTVVLAGFLLVAAQVVLRGWASLNGWFYADDFELLGSATDRALTLGYVLAPHDSQLMPGGLLLAWVVAHAGAFNWTLASVFLIVLQAAASLACLWMVITLFGRCWSSLALLAFYLFSPLTLTAFMWWSAALNQLPLQLAFFVAVTCYVRYLGDRRTLNALATVVALVVGLAFYVKAALIVLPLAVLTVRYAAPHRGSARWRAIAGLWPAWAGGAVVAAYAVYYTTHVRDPLSSGAAVPYGDVAEAMFGRSLGPAILGGPWRWSSANPPLGQVATPEWATTVSWVALAVWVAVRIRSGRGDWRTAAAIALPYLAAIYLLAARGRGGQLGGFLGLELRYLADAAPVLTLAAGLLVVGLRQRADVAPATPTTGHRAVTGVLAAVLVAGAILSTVRYAGLWTDYPAKAFAKNVMAESESAGALHLVDAPVPELVMSATSYPSNLPSRLFRPLGSRVDAVTQGTDLDALGWDGRTVPASIVGGASSVRGPRPGCGYLVSGRQAIPMQGAPQSYFWWLRIGYLAPRTGSLRVTLGGRDLSAPVEAGPHALYIRGEGSVQDLSVTNLDSADPICVDRVSIGNLASEPGS